MKSSSYYIIVKLAVFSLFTLTSLRSKSLIMMSPFTGKCNLASARSDPHLTEIDLNFTEDELNSARLAKTSNVHSNVPDAPLEGSQVEAQKEHSLQKISSVQSGPSSQSSSLETSRAIVRATEFLDSLGVDLPSCIKKMYTSNVSSGFWMGLPLRFCKSFLPEEDATFTLEDETGKQCEVKYAANKHGLSAGWKSFVLQHNLIEEDVLVFLLVETTIFKVYIFKASQSNEAGHALSLMNLGAHTEQPLQVTKPPKAKRNKRKPSLSYTVIPKRHRMSTPSGPVLECSILLKPYLFEEVTSFQDFHIMVKGSCIDHELPGDARIGYFKLCVDKKEFLHDGVLECASDKLVAGMICETVSIAKKIKGCKITTAKEDYETWDKFLSSFENLGMKVGFLRDKIHTLVTLAFESEGALDMKRYVEANKEHKRVEDEVKRVAAELKELEETAMKLEGITSGLKNKVEEFEQMIQEKFDAL